MESKKAGVARGSFAGCPRRCSIEFLCRGAHISPHWAMTTSWFGFSRVVLVCSIFLTTSMPSMTLPNTTCLLFRYAVATVVMKN